MSARPERRGRGRACARPALAAVAAVAVGCSVPAFLAGDPAAAAPPTPTCTPSGCTVTYAYVGAEQLFTVPSGVTSITVTAVGAAGAAGGTGDPTPLGVYNGGPDGPGGRGGKVTTSLWLTNATTTLYVEVGGTPTTDPAHCVPRSLTATTAVACVGGWNGGGDGSSRESATPDPSDLSYAGGGGGASDVRLLARASSGSLATRLVVAGGGGGGGGSDIGTLSGQPTSNGGAAGGDAGSAGADNPVSKGSGGHAGKPDGDSGGGCSSSDTGSCGRPGTVGLGGAGAGTGGVPTAPSHYLNLSSGGGGGGGGYWGGGGGGAQTNGVIEALHLGGRGPHFAAAAPVSPAPAARSTGGGGGGGGSWANGAKAAATPTSEAARVTLSWALTSGTPSQPGAATSPSAGGVPAGGSPGAPITLARTGVDVRWWLLGASLLVTGAVLTAGTALGRKRSSERG